MDTVFGEGDALSAEKRQISLGRCYRAYKAARKELDPEYKERGMSAKVSDRRRASGDSQPAVPSIRIKVRR